jgi:hypothetical protein
MSLRNLLSELKENTLATVRGVGIGGTLGAIKYPAASVMVLVDRLMAENPRLTFQEALQAINEQQAYDRETRPINAFGGELTGALNPAANLARLQSPIAMMAGGATQGAVAGFNERQDLGDAGMGAAAGTVLAGAGSLVGKGQEAAVRWNAGRVGAQRQAEARAAIEAQTAKLQQLREASQAAQRAGATKRELVEMAGDEARIRRSIQSLRQSEAKGKALAEGAKTMPADDLFAAVRPSIADRRFGQIAGSAVGDVLGTTRSRLGQGATDLGTMALLGGSGYMLGGAAGMDPMLGALLGAGAGRGAPLMSKKAAAAASMLPRVTGPAIGALGVQGVAPALGLANAQRASAAPVDEFDDLVPEDDFSDLVEE